MSTSIAIPLSGGFVAWIDATDLPLIATYTWQALRSKAGQTYAKTNKPSPRRGSLLMHRLIMDAPAGSIVDHRDGDGLNNRRANLRFATNAQNGRNRRGLNRNNTSGYSGVTWDKSAQRWQAQIIIDRRHVFLGRHDTAEEAARVFDGAAEFFYGEFARLNFPEAAHD